MFRHQVPSHVARAARVPHPVHAVRKASFVAKAVQQPRIATTVAAVQPMGSAATPVVAGPMPPAVPSMPVAPLAEVEPPVAAAPVAEVREAVKPQSMQPAVLKQLHNELMEVKQMHTNVATVEQTLAADVALLRESAMLQKMSTTQKGRADAQQQLRQVERLVKDTEAMVFRSRQTAVVRAREALQEAHEVQQAADALSQEAHSQLKFMETKKATAAPQTAPVVAGPVAPPQPVATVKPEADDDAVADAVTDDVAM